jgi:hypothetical protein
MQYKKSCSYKHNLLEKGPLIEILSRLRKNRGSSCLSAKGEDRNSSRTGLNSPHTFAAEENRVAVSSR